MHAVSEVVLVSLAACVTWGVLGSARVTRQVRFQSPLTPSDVNLPWEGVKLTASDGTALESWLIPHADPQGILILLHGFGACRADLLDLAQSLHAQGSYHLFMMDLRGHGVSGGSSITFGKKEVLDVETALKHCSTDPKLKDLPIGIFGLSMGGAIALLAAAQFPQIRAVVTDSAYAHLDEAILQNHALLYRLPRMPFGQVVLWGSELRLGCRLQQLSPIGVVEKIAPRPLLLIHGKADAGIPPRHAESLFQAAQEPKQIYLVDGAEHGASFYFDKAIYTQKVLEVMNNGLQ